jgi:hypothetical protein
VFLSTGNQAKPPNGLWQVRNFAHGNLALQPEFLCTIDVGAAMIGVGLCGGCAEGDAHLSMAVCEDLIPHTAYPDTA